MKIVVTGSAGYIGGQTVLQLKQNGYTVVGIDRDEHAPALAELLDYTIERDYASAESLAQIVEHQPDAIVHCAGSSLVGPSVRDPRDYYENNFVKTQRLANALIYHNLHSCRIVFSSSASVYGIPVMTPCQEEDPSLPISPYGESKMMTEMMLNSYRTAYGLSSINLRYFNASGADPQGRHGQKQDATHIFPRILGAIRNNEKFSLFGTKFKTDDGTCIRDYVHVSDIADAHVLAINTVVPDGTYNLASEHGYSNLEVIDVCEQVTGKKVKVKTEEPRAGDPATLFANSIKFRDAAGWQPRYNLKEIAEHAWHWHNQ